MPVVTWLINSPQTWVSLAAEPELYLNHCYIYRLVEKSTSFGMCYGLKPGCAIVKSLFLDKLFGVFIFLCV